MRRDAALNLLVNAKLFKGMKFLPGPDPRYVTFTVLDENSKLQSLLLKVSNFLIHGPYFLLTTRS